MSRSTLLSPAGRGWTRRLASWVCWETRERHFGRVRQRRGKLPRPRRRIASRLEIPRRHALSGETTKHTEHTEAGPAGWVAFASAADFTSDVSQASIRRIGVIRGCLLGRLEPRSGESFDASVSGGSRVDEASRLVGLLGNPRTAFRQSTAETRQAASSTTEDRFAVGNSEEARLVGKDHGTHGTHGSRTGWVGSLCECRGFHLRREPGLDPWSHLRKAGTSTRLECAGTDVVELTGPPTSWFRR